MRTLLCLMWMLIPLTIYGSIKKGSEPQRQAIELYEEDGSVKLVDIFNLPIGSKIKFKLPEEEGTCEGEITNVIINPDKNISVVGKIRGEGTPRFIFFATTNKTIGGAIFFPEKGITYALIHDNKRDVFLLQKKKLEFADK